MQNFKHQKFYIIIYEYFIGENLVYAQCMEHYIY